MSKLQELTDFIVHEMAKKGTAINGYELFKVLDRAIVQIEAVSQIDKSLYERVLDEEKKMLDEEAKASIIHRLRFIPKSEMPKIITYNKRYSDIEGSPYFLRVHSVNIAFIRKDLL